MNLLQEYHAMRDNEERKQDVCKNLESDMFSNMQPSIDECAQNTLNLTQTSSTSHTSALNVANVYISPNAAASGLDSLIFKVHGQNKS